MPRISEDELREAREVADGTPQSPHDWRCKRSALVLLRADAMQEASEILARSNGELSPAQAREYDRAEARVGELDTRIAQHDLAADREADARARRNPFHGGGSAAHGRMDGPYLRRDASMAEWVEARGLGQRDRDRYGMDESEQREFSLGRLVRGAVTGNWTDADLEQRALNSGASATGGILVPTITSAGVIDLLRSATRLFEAGAQVAPMGSEKVTLPRVTADPTPGWRAQSAPVAISDPAFTGVALETHTLAVGTKIAVELLEDISPEASERIQATLVAALAQEIDRAGFYGSGVGDEPLGIKDTPGVNVAAIATNGKTPTDYAELVKLAFAVRKRNAQPSAFVLAERTAEGYAGLTATDGQPLNLPPAIAQIPQLATTQLPTDLDEGTTVAAASDVFAGDFSNVVVGFRPEVGIRLASSPDAHLDSLEVLVVGFVRCDVAVLRPAALEVGTGFLA